MITSNVHFPCQLLCLLSFSFVSEQDCYDCIDLSDNEIAKLQNYSLLRRYFQKQKRPTLLPSLIPGNRLKTLNLCNNRISKIQNIGDSLPNIENIVLVNNKISDLRELENLIDCKSLVRLYLNGNPVACMPNYRLYAIFLIPSLRVLDFQKITKKVMIALFILIFKGISFFLKRVSLFLG